MQWALGDGAGDGSVYPWLPVDGGEVSGCLAEADAQGSLVALMVAKHEEAQRPASEVFEEVCRGTFPARSSS